MFLQLAYVLAVRGKRSEAFEHLTTLIHKAAKYVLRPSLRLL